MYCPSCGKLIEEGSTFCRYCGKPITSVAISVVTEPTKSKLVCPQCLQIDEIQRAKAIVSSGTRTGTTPVSRSGNIGKYTVWTTVDHQVRSRTTLAELLAPLSEAEFTLLMKSAAKQIVSTISLPAPSQPGYFILGAKPHESGKDQSLRRDALKRDVISRVIYKEYIKYWNELYYCGRCGVVFLQDNNKVAEIDDTSGYLLEQATDWGDDETCSISCFPLGGLWNVSLRLVAVVDSPNGRYIAGEITWQEGTSHFPSVRPECKKCAEVQEFLDSVLEKQRWPRIGRKPHSWNYARLSRSDVVICEASNWAERM